MTRVKRGPKRVQRRKRMLKFAKGFYGAKSRLYRSAKEAVEKALAYAYRGRKERKRDFYRLAPRDFEAYQYWLEKQGLKTNTRRRKILSAKSLVKYAVSRKKLAPSDIRFVKTPDRLERLPWILKPEDFSKVEGSLEPRTLMGLRNWLVVRLLAETGLSLAELCALRWDQWQGGALEVSGKRPRALRISSEAQTRLAEWREKNPVDQQVLILSRYLMSGGRYY